MINWYILLVDSNTEYGINKQNIPILAILKKIDNDKLNITIQSKLIFWV